jgi:hypothetical protein
VGLPYFPECSCPCTCRNNFGGKSGALVVVAIEVPDPL